VVYDYGFRTALHKSKQKPLGSIQPPLRVTGSERQGSNLEAQGEWASTFWREGAQFATPGGEVVLRQGAICLRCPADENENE
jgi:hypothetical protein